MNRAQHKHGWLQAAEATMPWPTVHDFARARLDGLVGLPLRQHHVPADYCGHHRAMHRVIIEGDRHHFDPQPD